MRYILFISLVALPLTIWAHETATDNILVTIPTIKANAISYEYTSTACTSRNTVTITTTAPASNYSANRFSLNTSDYHNSRLGTPASQSGQEPQKLKLNTRKESWTQRTSTPYGYYPMD